MYYYSTEVIARRRSVKKGVLRNSAKFTGQPRYAGVSFNKVAGSLQLYYKRESGTGVFL